MIVNVSQLARIYSAPAIPSRNILGAKCIALSTPQPRIDVAVPSRINEERKRIGMGDAMTRERPISRDDQKAFDCLLETPSYLLFIECGKKMHASLSSEDIQEGD